MNSINTIVYYVDLVVAYIWYYLTFVYDNFRDFAPVIKLATVSITLAVLLILFCLCRMARIAWRRRRLRKVNERLEERYGKAVRYILSEEAKPGLSRKEVLDIFGISASDSNKEHLKNYRERMLFCRMVYAIRISENAALGRRRNLHTMIGIFGLQPFLEEVINKAPWRYKVEAILMLRAFRLSINPWLANQLMSAKRRRIRRAALHTSVLSSSNTDLEYFESEFFDNNSCIYDEIMLGYVLQRRRLGKRKIPNLAHWAYLQKNPETQCIFVRLMRQFNQREYCSELEDLFQRDSDKELIEEISRTWGYLRYDEGEPYLAELLLTQPDETKVAIMHALTRMGTGKSLGALVDGYFNSGDLGVRFEALRCIYNYGESGRAKFAELEAAASPADRDALFSFFHNPLTLERLKLDKTDIYRPLFGENIFSAV